MYGRNLIIPKEEINRRVKLFQKKLTDNSIDYAIILQNADLFYFTGFVPSGVLLISPENSILFCKKEIDNVKNISNFENIVELKSIKNLKNYIKPSKILGFELDTVPYNIVNYYSKLLKPLELIDISHLIRDTKSIKSELEIGFIEKAAQLLEMLCNEIKIYLKPNIEEYKIFANAQNLLMKNGHQGFIRMRSFNQEMFYGHIISGNESIIGGYLDAPTNGKGLYPAFPQGSSKRLIQIGDCISIDLVGAYNGYYADQTRPFALGKIKEIFKQNFKKVIEIENEVINSIKPGVLWEDAYFKAISIARKLKVEDYFMGYKSKVKFVGHGIGVEVDEYPFLAPNFKKEFKENMVFALEPKIFIPDYGVIGIENTFVVKENYCNKLTLYPDKITTV